MPSSWRKLRSKLNTYGAALVLALLGALLALLLGLFLDSFSTLEQTHYEPKDIERGRLIDRK